MTNRNNTRKNIVQPADWWEAFEERAAKAGQSLSEWVGEQCKAALPQRAQAKLSERKTNPGPRPSAEKE